MARRFCAACGRESEVLVRGLCPECFTSRVGAVRGAPSRFRVKVCRFCGRVRWGNRWVEAGSFPAAVEVAVRMLAERLRPVEPLESLELEGWEPLSEPDWRTRVLVRLALHYRGSRIPYGLETHVELEPSICPLCEVRQSGEYDTVVQVRGLGGAEAMRAVEEALGQAGVWDSLIEVIEGRDGVDVYFTHRGAASRFVRALTRGRRASVSRAIHEVVGTNSSGRTRTRKTITVRILD